MTDLRYPPSDLTDAEWQLLAPLPPPSAETGQRRSWPMRELMNALFFVLRGGCPWRMLPEHFPPHQTAYRWFNAAISPIVPSERRNIIARIVGSPRPDGSRSGPLLGLSYTTEQASRASGGETRLLTTLLGAG
jgi:transposase